MWSCMLLIQSYTRLNVITDTNTSWLRWKFDFQDMEVWLSGGGSLNCEDLVPVRFHSRLGRYHTTMVVTYVLTSLCLLLFVDSVQPLRYPSCPVNSTGINPHDLFTKHALIRSTNMVLLQHQLQDLSYVSTVWKCGVKCLISEDCLSFNYAKLSGRCQLNDGNGEMYPSHLVGSSEFDYYVIANVKETQVWYRILMSYQSYILQKRLLLEEYIVRDFDNIFLWHESKDTNQEKRFFSKISVDSIYTFYVWLCALALIHKLLCLVSLTGFYIQKLCLFPIEMISAEFLSGHVLFRQELKINVKYSSLTFLTAPSI